MATLRGCCIIKNDEKLYGIEIDERSLGVVCDCVEAKAEEIDDWMYSETSQVFAESLTLYALARGLKEIRTMSPEGICDDANTP